MQEVLFRQSRSYRKTNLEKLILTLWSDPPTFKDHNPIYATPYSDPPGGHFSTLPMRLKTVILHVLCHNHISSRTFLFIASEKSSLSLPFVKPWRGSVYNAACESIFLDSVIFHFVRQFNFNLEQFWRIILFETMLMFQNCVSNLIFLI